MGKDNGQLKVTPADTPPIQTNGISKNKGGRPLDAGRSERYKSMVQRLKDNPAMTIAQVCRMEEYDERLENFKRYLRKTKLMEGFEDRCKKRSNPTVSIENVYEAFTRMSLYGERLNKRAFARDNGVPYSSLTSYEARVDLHNMAQHPVNCIERCRFREDPKADKDDLMAIQCSLCREYTHLLCIQLNALDDLHAVNFECANCTFDAKPKIELQKPQYLHRHDPFEPGLNKKVNEKPIQTGTIRFLREVLPTVETISSDGFVVEKLAEELTPDFFRGEGKEIIALVKSPKGLGMKLPSRTFTIDQAISKMDDSEVLPAIDVAGQMPNLKVTASQFGKYFAQKPVDRFYRLNLISYEISDKELKNIVKVPSCVREISWYHQLQKFLSPEDFYTINASPFCFMLISTEDSYTDAHVDFGGTSVWYHIFKGCKVFYVAKKTDANLKAYVAWQNMSKRSETWFGKMMEPGTVTRLEVMEGQTIFMPSGVIHAVFTPCDFLVFGGNYLHSGSAATQLSIDAMEEETKTEENYRVVDFILYAFAGLIEMGKIAEDCHSTKAPLPPWVAENFPPLLEYFKHAFANKEKNSGTLQKLPVVKTTNNKTIAAEDYVHLIAILIRQIPLT